MARPRRSKQCIHGHENKLTALVSLSQTADYTKWTCLSHSVIHIHIVIEGGREYHERQSWSWSYSSRHITDGKGCRQEDGLWVCWRLLSMIKYWYACVLMDRDYRFSCMDPRLADFKRDHGMTNSTNGFSRPSLLCGPLDQTKGICLLN